MIFSCAGAQVEIRKKDRVMVKRLVKNEPPPLLIGRAGASMRNFRAQNYREFKARAAASSTGVQTEEPQSKIGTPFCRSIMSNGTAHQSEMRCGGEHVPIIRPDFTEAEIRRRNQVECVESP
ncbi:MAG: hypothetical protein ABSH56_29505 [Bryobacteraceae bacterium]|jgi:hypothetical protein